MEGKDRGLELLYQIFMRSVVAASVDRKTQHIEITADHRLACTSRATARIAQGVKESCLPVFEAMERGCSCLLYTSDAADEEDSVDLGGRRIIKKKKKEIRGLIKKMNIREDV
eukprot:TRINITY_DN39402_c0_g1_i1.p1 TRINITY_DN39402_c0_g1~~TRINITY_DN39402_c0_g1_i1.p1  ORF type:complete len:113 (-),score=37.53 TRINITY_DN39402_c0_g1_i1:67-405(-)